MSKGTQAIKKGLKVFGIGFLGVLFLGCVISDSENSALVEQLQQENEELKLENDRLKIDIDVLEDELDIYKLTQQEPKEEPQVQQEEPQEEPVPVEEPKEEEPKEEPKSENIYIEKLQIQEVSSKEEYGILTVTVSLVADKNYTMLSVNIPLYDNEGYLIGNVTGFASDVKKGQKVKVECTSFDTGIYKIEELDIDSF